MLNTSKVDNNLCSNCVNEVHCTYKHETYLAVSQCEEHTISQEYQKKIEHTIEKSTFTAFLGLCSSCDHVNDCTLKEEQVAVICCEQYK
jgi:hypothetical protein